MGCLYTLTFPNGKLYVGITSRTAAERFVGHIEESVRHGSTKVVGNAIAKYDAENVVITELVQSDDWSELCAMERAHIKHLNTKVPHGYNMTDGGDGSAGLKWTAEQRAQRSADLVGNSRATGCKHTPEGLEKLRTIMLGNTRAKGNKRTPEGHERQRVSQIGREKSIYERGKIASAKSLAGALRNGRPVSLL